MKKRSIIYILINYIFLMSMTIYTIVMKVSLFEYLKIICVIFIFVNLILLGYEVIHLTFLQVKEASSFEMNIVDSEQEIKELLKEASKQDTLNEAQDETLLRKDKDAIGNNELVDELDYAVGNEQDVNNQEI